MRTATALILLLLMLLLEFCLVGLDTALVPIAYALTDGAESTSIPLAIGLAVLCLVAMFLICRYFSGRLASKGGPRVLAYLPFAAAAWAFSLGCLRLAIPDNPLGLLAFLSLPLFLISWLVVIGLLAVAHRAQATKGS